MAINQTNQIAQKYTDETYFTRNALRKKVGPNVDPYWQIVQKYRNAYAQPLNIKTIGNKAMYVVLTDLIKAKVSKVEEEVLSLANKLSSLKDEVESTQSKRACLSVCLSDFKALARVNISDLSFNALVNDTYFENNVEHIPLVNYLDSLLYFSSIKTNEFNVDSLCEEFQKCSQKEIISNIYRTRDWDNQAKNARYQMNAVFPYCPYDLIERLMDAFVSSVSNKSLSPLIRAVFALYYVDLIKPFESDNTGVAALSAKWIIAESTKNPLAFFLPFERLLNKGNASLKEAFDEVQKTGDLTYVLIASLSILSDACKSLQDKIADVRIDTYREESTRIPEIEEEVVVTPKPIPEPNVQKVGKQPREVVNGVEIIPHEAKKPVAPVQTLTAEEIESSPITRNPTLSDREVKELVIYLMETEPDLNKKQASFYATHCTEGRYYTIQQFKAYTKCVYETARTSMDKLAAKGFYKKCALKNKFVYTPAKKRR